MNRIASGRSQRGESGMPERPEGEDPTKEDSGGNNPYTEDDDGIQLQGDCFGAGEEELEGEDGLEGEDLGSKSQGIGSHSSGVGELKIFKQKDIRSWIVNAPPRLLRETQLLLEKYEKQFSHWKFQLISSSPPFLRNHPTSVSESYPRYGGAMAIFFYLNMPILCRNGFNLLFYGFGSKIELLQKFASKSLNDGAAIVINAYNPLINIKQILLEILGVLILRSSKTDEKNVKNLNRLRSQSTKTIMNFLSQQQFDRPPLYLVVHNIDGRGLKEGNNQKILLDLALCSIKFVASVDNIHAPLMWSPHMETNEFRWWWHHTPTYQPYKLEAAFTPPLLSASLSERTTDGALVVLKTLTANSRSIFQILADFSLNNPEEPGLPFQRWYTLCREKFLVNNDLALRTHLTEFKDHELVKVRKGGTPDAPDCFYIPFSKELLKKLVEDMNS